MNKKKNKKKKKNEGVQVSPRPKTRTSRENQLMPDLLRRGESVSVALRRSGDQSAKWTYQAEPRENRRKSMRKNQRKEIRSKKTIERKRAFSLKQVDRKEGFGGGGGGDWGWDWKLRIGIFSGSAADNVRSGYQQHSIAQKKKKIFLVQIFGAGF